MNNEEPLIAIADLTPLWIRILTPRVHAEFGPHAESEGTTFRLGAVQYRDEEDKAPKFQRLIATSTLIHNDGLVSVRITSGLLSGPLDPRLVIDDDDEDTRRMVERTATDMLYDHARRTALAAAALVGREIELPYRAPIPTWTED